MGEPSIGPKLTSSVHFKAKLRFRDKTSYEPFMDEFCAWARYARLEELLTLHPTHSCLTEHAAPYEKIVGGTAAAPHG